MTITEIKNAVQKLSTDEQKELCEWLDELRDNQWDQQIEKDLQSGKLNHLIEQAKKEFRQGECQQI